MGTALVFAVSALLTPLLLSEFVDWCPRLAERLVRWSAGRLRDPVDRDRYLEEYLANLAAVPGKASRLVAATGYAVNVLAMRGALGRRGAVRSLLAGQARRDRRLIRRAYVEAERVHRGERRLSGDPYITHAVAVAEITRAYDADAVTLAAALLHDNARPPVDNAAFWRDVGGLIDVMKTADRFDSSDTRLLLVAIADRLHNLRTIEFVPPEKRARVGTHTLDVVVPLADRLGYDAMSRELTTLAVATLAS
jgi:hypothetical protein